MEDSNVGSGGDCEVATGIEVLEVALDGDEGGEAPKRGSVSIGIDSEETSIACASSFLWSSTGSS